MTGIVGAVFFTGVKLSQTAVGKAARTVTLSWDVNEPTPGTITEVWSSPDLKSRTLKTNVVGTNRVTFPCDQPAEFFKVRNRIGEQVSDWARKP